MTSNAIIILRWYVAFSHDLLKDKTILVQAQVKVLAKRVLSSQINAGQMSSPLLALKLTLKN